MIIPGKARLSKALTHGTARSLNAVYTLASAARSKSLEKMAQRYPRSFVLPPEDVETQTMHRIGPTLQHVVRDVTGTEPPLDQVTTAITDGISDGLFHSYGEAIFINPHRVDDLLPQLGVAAQDKANFLKEAGAHYLLREYIYRDQAASHFTSSFRALDRGRYIETGYKILTRDGKFLTLTRIINQDRVKTNDTRPSVLLVPGIACNHGIFDVNDDDSLALDLADQGHWVYMFDPRGMGRNKGEFDPQCFFDTLVSNDLPAAVDFIFNRPSPKKPVVVVGYSMGGMISEFMLIRQAHKLNVLLAKLSSSSAPISTRITPRSEITAFLDRTEATETTAESRARIAEARTHLAILNTVKGLVTLASPKIFDKDYHPLYPVLLMLNILLPAFRFEDVPVDLGKWIIKRFPFAAMVGRPLINPENFDDPNAFLAEFIENGTDTFPLGVGLQLLRAIYSGKGVRRMDKDRFNYPEHVDEIPFDLPVFHLGTVVKRGLWEVLGQ